jgi:hypothetical protein
MYISIKNLFSYFLKNGPVDCKKKTWQIHMLSV